MATSDVVTVPKIAVGNVSPPASYATGGFLLDLSASFVNLGAVRLSVETLGSLPPCHFQILYNVDTTGAQAFGKCVIKIMRHRYDKASLGAVSGIPGGTATQSALFAAGTTTGSSHTHSINHDHPATNSGVAVAAGGAATSGAVNMVNHIHSVDVAAFTGSSGANTHSHNRAFQYEHNHSFTETANTDATITELAATTNLSTTVFRYMAVGLGDQ